MLQDTLVCYILTLMVEYLSFGGGPPSVALLILNAWGEVEPKAEIVVFADTGWEKSITNQLIPEYQSWAEEMGMEFVKTQSHLGPLDDYLREKSAPIPLYKGGPGAKGGSMGHRQCTDQWKIRPIERYLHDRFGKVGLTAQLAMTWGEAHRMRDNRIKRNTNRWPLIEKRLTRQDCVEIIKMAGLTVPPWSACVGCPMQNTGTWSQLASRWPDDFQKAVDMDEHVRARAINQGQEPLWLHASQRPLASVVATEQMSFPMDDSGEVLEGCSDANCFT